MANITLEAVELVMEQAKVEFPAAKQALLVADGELLLGGLHVADQGFSAHELGIDHRGAKALAQQAEANVGNIFHRCQKHRV